MLLNCGVGKDSWESWTAGRSNQSTLKEISPGCSLEGLMLKLKLQYVGHLMWRTDSLENTLMLGKIEGRRRRDTRGWDGWMASQTRWTWVWTSSRSWWWTGKPGALQSTGSQWVRHDWATEMNWTEGGIFYIMWYFFHNKKLCSREKNKQMSKISKKQGKNVYIICNRKNV